MLILGGGNSWKLDGYQNWQDAKDQCGERYNMNFDTYITIENIPNGEYEFGVQGFYRDGTGEAAIQNYHESNFTPNAKIYANSNTTDMQSIAVANRTTEFNGTDSRKEISGTTYYVPNNQYMAEVYTYAGYYPWQNVKTIVTDGTLRFGVKKESTISNDWTIVDKFYLSYLGPTIAAKASALPAGDMTANTWYYFDIALDGEYNLKLTTLSDIVYTTDNTILYENENSVTANFSGTSAISLTAGRYYVKSASAQTLTVEANSYDYNVGDPTSSIADNSYQQTISTVTLNFESAASNDPGATFAILDNTAKATLKLSGSTVAEGTLSLNGKVLTATFPETALTMGSTYTLELPANVVGYADQAANTAVSITVKTPAFADGFYYLYNTDTKTYLSRSGNYATQAIMDNRGLAVKITTDTEGKSIVQYFDNLLYLGINGFCYGDAGTAHQFTVTAVEGGYKFLCVSNSKYLAVYEGQSVNDAVEGGNLQGTSNIWALETPAQHEANYTTNANTQAATAASNVTALSSITTKSALDTELAANYGETNINITGSKDAKYQVYADNSQALSEAEYYKETVENLKPGLYKLSVNAFQRASWYDWVNEAGGARGNIYVYANDAKTQIKSVMEYGADEAYSSNWASGGKNYPNDDPSAYTALATGNYTNEVYVYVEDEGEGTGTLVFGINNPTRQGNGVNNGTWAVYDNFSLKLYEAKATTEEKAALAAAITAAEAKTLGFEADEYAPYNNVAALTALAAAKAIDPETATGAAVVAATTALTGATWTANTTEENAIYDGTFAIQAEHTTGPTALAGWNNPEGIRQLIKNTETYPGLNSAIDNAAVFAWGNTTLTYGNSEGYTMPLADHTIYELTFKTCGWSDGDMGYVNVTVLNDNNEGMTQQTSATATKRIDKENPWNEFSIKFVTGDAGNYKLGMWTSKHTVFTDVVLKKAASQVLEFAADNSAMPTYAAGTYPAVTLSRTIKAGYNTLVLPFAVTADEVTAKFGAGSKVYVVSEYETAKDNIKLAAQNGVEANKPVILKATTAGSSYEFTNKAVAATEATPTKEGTGVSMIGTYAASIYAPTDNTAYVISGDKIYLVDSEVTIKNTRAYISIPTQSGEAKSKLNLIFDDGEATSIDGIAEGDTEGNGKMYDLSGREVKNPTKGIYIKNGKKVYVK